MFFLIKTPQTAEEFKHYYHLRWKILRAPWNQAEGSEIDDMEDQCFHVMAITAKNINHANNNKNNDVVGVARLQFNSNTEAQIRYMAVAKTYQRKGIGGELINALENHAKNSGSEKIVLHAREPAVDFYRKQGYQVIKKSYLLFDEIQHYKMMKELTD